MAFHLYIMRHAKTNGVVPGSSDFDRTLTERGEENAVDIGQWMKKNGQVPQIIISSSAVRAKQTTELVVGELSDISKEKVLFEKDLYLADSETLIEFIQLYKNDVDSLMLVAHNPGLEQLIYFLSGKSDIEYRGMSPANMAIFEYPNNNFDPAIDKGALIQFVDPKELD